MAHQLMISRCAPVAVDRRVYSFVLLTCWAVRLLGVCRHRHIRMLARLWSPLPFTVCMFFLIARALLYYRLFVIFVMRRLM